MPCVGFEPTIPDSEQAKTIHVLDRSATGILMIITHGISIFYDQTLFMRYIQKVHEIHAYQEVIMCPPVYLHVVLP
jgi:hypothetical protein